jgi:putative phosphoesterase
MSTRIGIISDTHCTTAPLQEALEIFKDQGASQIICAGDITGYGEDELEETIALLREYDCLTVIGNHDVVPDSVTDPSARDKIQSFFDGLPKKIELEVEGKKIYVVHAHPPDSQHGGIKIMDPRGKVVEEKKTPWINKLANVASDILVIGHTHQVFAEYFGRLLVINPGSSCFNHTCMLLTLPAMTVEIIPLSGKKPVMTWNWSVYFREQGIDPGPKVGR